MSVRAREDVSMSTRPPEVADGGGVVRPLPRRVYKAPRLVQLGSVRDLTLGQSGGRRIDLGSRTRYM